MTFKLQDIMKSNLKFILFSFLLLNHSRVCVYRVYKCSLPINVYSHVYITMYFNILVWFWFIDYFASDTLTDIYGIYETLCSAPFAQSKLSIRNKYTQTRSIITIFSSYWILFITTTIRVNATLRTLLTQSRK